MHWCLEADATVRSLAAAAEEKARELWVNTSEAEIQPAASPAYELSKRLIGQLVSLRGANLGPTCNSSW